MMIIIIIVMVVAMMVAIVVVMGVVMGVVAMVVVMVCSSDKVGILVAVGVAGGYQSRLPINASVAKKQF